MIGKLLGALGVVAVPALAVVTAIGVGLQAGACISTSALGPLNDRAPVPPEARPWIREVRAGCPDLPEVWIAAVMAQESGFRPDAYADDSNGGTWGLFQLNQSIWRAHYGHPWSADLDHDGRWDVTQPEIHASVAGRYLCARLAGVRGIRTEHPDWPSASIPELDALIVAHNAGESRLRSYPAIPTVTARFISNVDERVRAWSGSDPPDSREENPSPSAAEPAATSSDPPTSDGCVPELGDGTVNVPPGTSDDVATAVSNALAYVGVKSGWDQLCDRLACRAYGYVGSGFTSAKVHWQTMVADGHAHPGDRCPPLGSFVFFETGRPFGHVSIVVRADPGRCDPEQILVTSNSAFDAATGNHGGVYLLSLGRLNSFYLRGSGYLGWSDPVCRGALLPTGTSHPAPPGR
ncbi:lytic transglycosylase domain-containing protein [Cellulomonas fimi]|uniref:transglycosylase SLT domain-containing protein n=1 Tax=Cellulomonas fimi TaxID=1708 RepID=UPI00234C55C8|nr:transglycosylase SLT domain-containing protein [Cellulomonas fimi]MDC7120572.1 lytic transglycosylase domain-containing protein [Cellulomonas fimi]